MTTLLAHFASFAAVFAAGYFLLYRPIRNLIQTEARKMDARVKEIETIADAVKAADAERARTLREIAVTMDQIRITSADFMRQEAKKIVEKGIEELQAAKEAPRETFHV